MQQAGLIDLHLSRPAALFARQEDLDRHQFATQNCSPHLTESTLADHVDQFDFSGDRSFGDDSFA